MKRIKGEFKLKLVISGAIIFAVGILITSIGELQGGNLYRAMTHAAQSMGIEIDASNEYIPDTGKSDKKDKEEKRDNSGGRYSYGDEYNYSYGDAQMREFFRDFGLSDEEIDMFFGGSMGSYGEEGEANEDYQTVPGYDRDGREYY